MRALVTGGAAFIGSAVVRYLIDHTGASVINVDALTHAGNLDSLSEAAGSDRYTFYKSDICLVLDHHASRLLGVAAAADAEVDMLAS